MLFMWESSHPFMLFPIYKCNWRIDLITIRGKSKQNIFTPHTYYPSVSDWEPLSGLCCVPKHSLSVKCLLVHFVPCPERALNQWPPIISQHCGHAGYHTYPVRTVLVGAWREASSGQNQSQMSELKLDPLVSKHHLKLSHCFFSFLFFFLARQAAP